MDRIPSLPRTNWKAAVEEVGLTYHTHTETGVEKPYWFEEAAYVFSAAEIDLLEKSMRDLHFFLIDVAEDVIKKGSWDRLAIPEHMIPLIIRSWEADEFSLYGRFDLAYTPGGSPKLLEYNADTPTSLVEASIAQWYWLKATHPDMDQFNSIHERLVNAWKRFKELNSSLRVIDFSSVSENLEDEQTISYLVDTAIQGGFLTRWTDIKDIGFDSDTQCFVSSDFNGQSSGPMTACFKLYPWEWLANEDFGTKLIKSPTQWIEPSWKALLSNKAILALAWERDPHHPNLLPCYFDESKLGRSWVRKPKLSREGANISIVKEGITIAKTDGDYGEDGYIFQQIAEIPNFSGNHPILGGWIVDHEPAGLGIRESDGLVTDNVSRFVPHFFRP